MWPWKRQSTDQARLAELEAGFATLKAEVRAALREVSEVSERAYKFLKRAEQRARRELDQPAANQERPGAAPGVTPSPGLASSRRAAWGARGRRLRRGDPALELDQEANGDGVHS